MAFSSAAAAATHLTVGKGKVSVMRGGGGGGGGSDGGRQQRGRRLRIALAIFVACCVAVYGALTFTLAGTFTDGDGDGSSSKRLFHQVAGYKEKEASMQREIDQLKRDLRNAKRTSSSSVGESPLASGVPPNDAATRHAVARHSTRYWRETEHLWPSEVFPPTEKYLSFEPWQGGFNNIRMSLEMAAALAFALKRTLVLPPAYRMYLRGHSSLQDYFDLTDLGKGLPVVTYEQFAERVDLKKYASMEEKVHTKGLNHQMHEYYKGVANIPKAAIHNKEFWGGGRIGSQVVYCMPRCPNHASLRGRDQGYTSQVKTWYRNFHRDGRLHGIDTDVPEIEDASVIHLPQNLLGHFYTFVWFADPQLGRAAKRLVRDHIHFKEGIFERAERIIDELGGDFEFSCLHIRRNDFQFKEEWTTAEDIVKNVKGLFKEGEHIYISTDELSSKEDKKKRWSDPEAMLKVKSHSWFKPMFDAWGADNVHFLSEYHDRLLKKDTDKTWLGCVESAVCTRARVFAGTRKSTFSGYINRMRGYMHDVGQDNIFDAQTKFPDGYYEGFKGPSWYTLQHAFGGGHPYWGREYTEAWTGVYQPLY